MAFEYKISHHSAYNINYHIVFCPKRRKSVLVDDIIVDLEEIVNRVCQKLNCKVESLAIQPDHVHLFVSAPPTLAPHLIVKNIKGVSAHELRPRYSILQKIPAMWSRSYYIGTVGHVSEDVVKQYIARQNKT